MKYFDINLRNPHELKKQYRRLVFRLHPDTGGTKEAFQQLQREYDSLIAILEREAAAATEPTPEQEEVIQGFDWEILTRPIFDAIGQPIAGYKAIYNNKTNELLNVAKESYTPTTNARFTEMIEYLRDVSGYAIGNFYTLNGGKKVLANLEKTDRSVIVGHDFAEHIVVGNAHDYSSSFFVGYTSMMYRCENMFSTDSKQLKAYHTSNHEAHLKELKAIFTAYNSLNVQTHDNLEKFSLRPVSAKEKLLFLRHVLSLPPSVNYEDVSKRKQFQIDELNDSINSEMKDLGKTAFGLLQGATHYTTHKQKQLNRVFGNIYGSTAANNKRAYDYCKELIK